MVAKQNENRGVSESVVGGRGYERNRLILLIVMQRIEGAKGKDEFFCLE